MERSEKRITFETKTVPIIAKLMDFDVNSENKKPVKKCKDSPDGKHHYEVSMTQHLIRDHCDYVCVFCGQGKCVNIRQNIPNPLSLPTDEDLDNG